MIENKTIQEEFTTAIKEYDNVIFIANGIETKSFKTKELVKILEFEEKSKPKQPLGLSWTHDGRVGNCPMCKILVSENTSDVFGKKMNICICGQKLKWPQRSEAYTSNQIVITTETVLELRNKTGSGMMECKRALEYARDHHDERLAMAYLRARTLAVATPGLTFDERVLSFLER